MHSLAEMSSSPATTRSLIPAGNALGAAGRSLQVRAEWPTIRHVFEVTRLETMLIALG
ncbi:MAG TPA: hypothetical protein VK988_16800 [Acidimicrobiales bacterium]|nr:hypothetical protein [Acidimicrobiales bacterium]